jgi:hypothetical protein
LQDESKGFIMIHEMIFSKKGTDYEQERYP